MNTAQQPLPAAEQIVALEAKTALLAASLRQAEKETFSVAGELHDCASLAISYSDWIGALLDSIKDLCTFDTLATKAIGEYEGVPAGNKIRMETLVAMGQHLSEGSFDCAGFRDRADEIRAANQPGK